MFMVYGAGLAFDCAAFSFTNGQKKCHETIFRDKRMEDIRLCVMVVVFYNRMHNDGNPICNNIHDYANVIV
jgi:hypothetical protein